MKKTFVFILCTVTFISVQAQKVVSSAGGTLSRDGVSCTYTVGNVFACSGTLLSTGVSQPATPVTYIPVETDRVRIAYEASSQTLSILTDGAVSGNLVCEVYTANGMLALKTLLPEDTEKNVSLQRLAKGLYLVKITGKNYLNTYKLLKK